MPANSALGATRKGVYSVDPLLPAGSREAHLSRVRWRDHKCPYTRVEVLFL
jgi:hypothetical protein